MSAAPHTAGPWRWEFNHKQKSMHLVGGRPQFDLTIMDFSRWGMGGAIPNMRDTAHDGMNIMYRVCDRPDWVTPFAGRKHHADWCADVVHPDLRLMAAAPDLLDALQEAKHVFANEYPGHPTTERIFAAIEKATGEPG